MIMIVQVFDQKLYYEHGSASILSEAFYEHKRASIWSVSFMGMILLVFGQRLF